MPHTPPFDRRALTKEGIFNDDRFFRLLSERCNYVDDATVRMFYLGLVKLIVSELRTNGAIRLPHIGDFALIKQMAKTILSGRTADGMPRRINADPLNMLKFYPKYTLRLYFQKFNRPLG